MLQLLTSMMMDSGGGVGVGGDEKRGDGLGDLMSYTKNVHLSTLQSVTHKAAAMAIYPRYT